MNKRGFTLIELLAVIMILGILSSLAVICYVNYLNNARDKAFKVAEKDFANKKLTQMSYSLTLLRIHGSRF